MDKKKLNRACKKKVYALCKKAANGDKQAHIELNKEAEKNSTARWAIKHWKKINQKGCRDKYNDSSSIYSKRRNSPRTAEEIARQKRIDERGYHDGAKVAGSDLRRVNK